MKRKLLRAGLLLMALILAITWWIWPRENLTTNELLAQIKPGMTFKQAIELLGNPVDACILTYKSASHGPSYFIGWERPEHFLLPKITANVPDDTIPMKDIIKYRFWMSHDTLVCVISDTKPGTIDSVWRIPIRREGGGVAGVWRTVFGSKKRFE